MTGVIAVFVGLVAGTLFGFGLRDLWRDGSAIPCDDDCVDRARHEGLL